MTEVKVRADSINALMHDQRGIPSPLVREYCILQIRMLCEIVALGCLVAHGDLVEKAKSILIKAYKPGDIFAELDRLHDDYFPVPIAAPTGSSEKGWHFAQRVGEHLATKAEIKEIWNRCGAILHRGSLKGLVKAQSPVQYQFADVSNWGQRVLDLLSSHRILSFDGQFAIIATIPPGEDVRVLLGEVVS